MTQSRATKAPKQRKEPSDSLKTSSEVSSDVETSEFGLTPAAAGALTQLRAFATVYQEIVQCVMTGKALPDVLDSVLQPHVEFYKKNLKGGVVVPGRISK